MRLEEVLEALTSIAELSPRLRGWLATKTKLGEYTGRRWALLMVHLDADCFHDAVAQYTTCHKKLPESCEELMHDLIESSRDAKAELDRKWAQHEAHHSRKRMVWRDKSRIPCAVAIQHIMRRGPVSAQQLDELVAWDRGGARPEWLS